MKTDILTDSMMPTLGDIFNPVYKVKSPMNAHEFKTTGELNELASETIPDQTMSIREILRRYAAGVTDMVTTVPEYDFDETDDENWDVLPDPKSLDPVDRAALMAELKNEIDSITKKPTTHGKAHPKEASSDTAKSEGKNSGSDDTGKPASHEGETA